MQPKLGLILALTILVAVTSGMADPRLGAGSSPSMTTSKLPLAFEPNQGQAAQTTRFLSHAGGYDVLVLDNGMTVVGRAAADKERPAVWLRLVGSKTPDFSGRDLMPGKTNYYVGPRSAWHLDVSQYGSVLARGVYPGIDVVYYGHQRQLEYDFVVAAGADPKQIQIVVSGADPKLDANGDIALNVDGQSLLLHRPVAYQEFGAERRSVKAEYVLRDRTVLLAIGEYDSKKPLVIDPTLSYVSYLGGSGLDSANAIAVDTAGNSYVTGQTCSTDLASAGYGGNCDAFVIALNPTGTAALYTTYVGGKNGDAAKGIAVDASGVVTIAGITSSTDFPTASPFQASYGGGDNDGFVAQLDAAGHLIYSSYLGGSQNDTANGVALDSVGNVVVAGQTGSLTGLNDFPATPPFVPNYDGFITKLTKSSGFQARAFSVFFVANSTGTCDGANAVAVDLHDDVFVAGTAIKDCQTPTNKSSLIGKFSGVDGSLIFGWVDQNHPSEALAVAVDKLGHPVVTGNSKGSVFVEKVNALGSDVLFNTTFGPSCSSGTCSTGNGIALDGNGAIYITGFTTDAEFSVVSPTQSSLSGPTDAFVTKFDPTGTTQLFSTFFGGVGAEVGSGIAVDTNPTNPSIYVVGTTYSLDLPVTSGALKATNAGAGDAFLAKWTGPTPFASLDKPQLNFGDTTINTTSPAQTVTLKNLGDAQLEVFGITASSPFQETHTCGKFVSPGASCTISVTFAPSAIGLKTGVLTLTSNFGTGSQTIALSGNSINSSGGGGGGNGQGDFTLTLNPGSASVNAGNSTSFTVATTPTGGLATTVTFSCAGPATITCAVSPGSVALNGQAAANVTVTVTTQSRSNPVGPGSVGRNMPAPMSRPDVVLAMTQLPFGIAGILVVGAGRKRGSRKTQVILGASVILLVLLLMLGGCGGGGSRMTTGTQAGTYAVTITATATQGSTTLTHTVTASVTVN